jgi:hypothetical protein
LRAAFWGTLGLLVLYFITRRNYYESTVNAAMRASNHEVRAFQRNGSTALALEHFINNSARIGPETGWNVLWLSKGWCAGEIVNELPSETWDGVFKPNEELEPQRAVYEHLIAILEEQPPTYDRCANEITAAVQRGWQAVNTPTNQTLTEIAVAKYPMVKDISVTIFKGLLAWKLIQNSYYFLGGVVAAVVLQEMHPTLNMEALWRKWHDKGKRHS